MKTKLTKKQLTRDLMNLFEIADELLLEHKDGYFAPDFDDLEKILKELSGGQSFYKRWGRPTPAEERLKTAKSLGHTLEKVTNKHYGKNIN